MSAATVRAYEALLVLYPRPFRREFGDDMAMLFAEQLRDESSWRVCGRAATDLAITIPTRYLEAFMRASTSPFLSALFGAIAVAGLTFAVVSATNVGIALPAAAVAIVAGGLGVASSRRNRPMAPPPRAGVWWKLVVAGVGLLSALVVAVNLTGEVPEGFWFPMVITGLVAVTLVAMGLILAVSRLGTRSTAPQSGAG